MFVSIVQEELILILNIVLVSNDEGIERSCSHEEIARFLFLHVDPDRFYTLQRPILDMNQPRCVPFERGMIPIPK